MNIIFMRHGESTDNTKELISDKEIYWSILTENGVETALESVKGLPKKIDKIYVSPFPRTIETAHFVFEKYPTTDVIIDNRIREINSGKYSHKKNNSDLDNTRIKQINGDYFVRFGDYGDNKYSIENRLCDFLKDIYENNFKNNTILIVSHGSIIAYIKRILGINSPHIKTGKVEEFIDVNFEHAFAYIKKLNKIRLNEIKKRVEIINKLEINSNLKNNLIKMIKKEFNNIEFTDEVFLNYINGLSTKKLKKINNSKFDNGIILICFYNNFENFARKWMEHYMSIGIKNFVLIDNNSTDDSTKLLKEYESVVNISFWKINEMYNCYKMCGWKQQIFEYYGNNKIYLTVDSDELFIYKNYKEISLKNFIKEEQISSIKTMMLDVYSNQNIYNGKLKDFKYVDKNTYKTSTLVPYGVRFLGGPRFRVLGINPSLQKVSLIKYTGKEVYINDHFYYPWNINNKAVFCSYLLHYNLLSEDGHLDNYKEYKIYENKNVNFYDKKYSILIDDIEF